MLFESWRRAKIRTVVASAGYDSEANHGIARLNMNVRSIIPPRIGRPSANFVQKHRNPHMYRWYKDRLQLFIQTIPADLTLDQLKPLPGSSD